MNIAVTYYGASQERRLENLSNGQLALFAANSNSETPVFLHLVQDDESNTSLHIVIGKESWVEKYDTFIELYTNCQLDLFLLVLYHPLLATRRATFCIQLGDKLYDCDGKTILEQYRPRGKGIPFSVVVHQPPQHDPYSEHTLRERVITHTTVFWKVKTTDDDNRSYKEWLRKLIVFSDCTRLFRVLQSPIDGKKLVAAIFVTRRLCLGYTHWYHGYLYTPCNLHLGGTITTFFRTFFNCSITLQQCTDSSNNDRWLYHYLPRFIDICLLFCGILPVYVVMDLLVLDTPELAEITPKTRFAILSRVCIQKAKVLTARPKKE